MVADRFSLSGGFSIVFLVKHCQPRQNSGRLYALKRQFINEPALLEACRREIEITKTLGVRHPNIITYIASSLTPVPNSDGNVYEYLLLTQYYRGSVLRLMNERLSIGQWLSTEEVLRIFTDVCAAVARLHHCQTPVIHRDLKVSVASMVLKSLIMNILRFPGRKLTTGRRWSVRFVRFR